MIGCSKPFDMAAAEVPLMSKFEESTLGYEEGSSLRIRGQRDRRHHQIYWALCLIILVLGATNIMSLIHSGKTTLVNSSAIPSDYGSPMILILLSSRTNEFVQPGLMKFRLIRPGGALHGILSIAARTAPKAISCGIVFVHPMALSRWTRIGQYSSIGRNRCACRKTVTKMCICLRHITSYIVWYGFPIFETWYYANLGTANHQENVLGSR